MEAIRQLLVALATLLNMVFVPDQPVKCSFKYTPEDKTSVIVCVIQQSELIDSLLNDLEPTEKPLQRF